VLAGSWTDTGWPDTMEGAVRSGLNAVLALRAGSRNSVGVTGATKSKTVVAGATGTEVNDVDKSAVSSADSARGVRS